MTLWISVVLVVRRGPALDLVEAERRLTFCTIVHRHAPARRGLAGVAIGPAWPADHRRDLRYPAAIVPELEIGQGDLVLVTALVAATAREDQVLATDPDGLAKEIVLDGPAKEIGPDDQVKGIDPDGQVKEIDPDGQAKETGPEDLAIGLVGLETDRIGPTGPVEEIGRTIVPTVGPITIAGITGETIGGQIFTITGMAVGTATTTGTTAIGGIGIRTSITTTTITSIAGVGERGLGYRLGCPGRGVHRSTTTTAAMSITTRATCTTATKS